jgi:hypothetical protein
MNCELTNKLLDDYLSGGLSGELQSAIEDHARYCGGCAETLQAARFVSLELRRFMAVPEPDDAVFSRAIDRALDVVPEPTVAETPRRFWAGAVVGAAIAASLVLGLVNMGVIHTGTQVVADPARVGIALHQSRNLDFALQAQQDIEDAELTVRLVGAVQLVGYQGQREVRWTTRLAKGTNRLTLPVVGTGLEGGRVIVQLVHGDRFQVYDVDVSVSADTSSHLDRLIFDTRAGAEAQT